MATPLQDDSDLRNLPAAASQDDINPAKIAYAVGPLVAAPALPGALTPLPSIATTVGVYTAPSPLERERNRGM